MFKNKVWSYVLIILTGVIGLVIVFYPKKKIEENENNVLFDKIEKLENDIVNIAQNNLKLKRENLKLKGEKNEGLKSGSAGKQGKSGEPSNPEKGEGETAEASNSNTGNTKTTD